MSKQNLDYFNDSEEKSSDKQTMTENPDTENFGTISTPEANFNFAIASPEWCSRVHYNPDSLTGSTDEFSASDPLMFQRFRTYGMGAQRKHRKSRRTKTRLITDDGSRNTILKNVEFSVKTTITGAFQRLVNMGWPGQFVFFSGCFLISWLFFAFLWWSLESVGRSVSHTSSDWHCVTGLTSFFSAILFSIETQSTIGYGSHYITNSCYPGFLVLFLQIVFGSILQGVLVAIVISKFTHPKFRRADILFSKNLCISEENQQFVLSFRIADSFNGAMSMPQSHVRVYLIHSVEEEEEEGAGCMAMQELDVGYDKGQDRVVLMVPWVVHHVIDAESPLYNKCYDDIANDLFEIVIILEGSVEETGSVTQCLKSYVAEDVLWGYTFDSMISKSKGKFKIDFAKMNSCTQQSNVPVCLAKTVPKKKLSNFIPISERSILQNLKNRRKSVHASYQATREDDDEEDDDPQPEFENVNENFSLNAEDN